TTADASPTPTKTPLPKATELRFWIDPETVRRTQESSGCCAVTSTPVTNNKKAHANLVRKKKKDKRRINVLLAAMGDNLGFLVRRCNPVSSGIGRELDALLQ